LQIKFIGYASCQTGLAEHMLVQYQKK
jgi:hypothetical protein